VHRQGKALVLDPCPWDLLQILLQLLCQGCQLWLQAPGYRVAVGHPRANNLQAMIASEIQCHPVNTGSEVGQGAAAYNTHPIVRVVYKSCQHPVDCRAEARCRRIGHNGRQRAVIITQQRAPLMRHEVLEYGLQVLPQGQGL
jgi:hypothetical protein